MKQDIMAVVDSGTEVDTTEAAMENKCTHAHPENIKKIQKFKIKNKKY